jgi:hypothetical protein
LTGRPRRLCRIDRCPHQRSGTRWRLIARKTVGKPDQWPWYAVEVCSLTVTQSTNLPEGPAPLEAATVSLLTPLAGCSKGYAKDWVVP